MLRSRRLSAELLRSQVTVLVVALAIGTGLFLALLHRDLTAQIEQRVLAIARSVAADPQIVDAAAHGDPGHVVQARAEAVRVRTKALFVVVTDDRGIRLSHPDPTRIGERVSTDPSEALSGREVVAVERGTLGPSARAKVPLVDGSGRVIGEVSVGVAANEITDSLRALLPSALLYTLVALGVGVVASLGLSRRLKRRTFGLELDELAALLREREAMLHGIREGVVALAPSGRVTLVNDEARRLLALGGEAVGRTLGDLVPDGRLLQVLDGRASGADEVVLTDRYCLVVNRMPVRLGGQDLGAVVTLRDRTEQEGLLRELDNVRGLTDALRAQQHEFTNRMHTMTGLLELGRTAEALDYARTLSVTARGLADRLQNQVRDPFVLAMLLAKASVADERGVQLVVSEDTYVEHPLADADPVLTVLGNLVDNALDATAGEAGERRVSVSLVVEDDTLVLEVGDTGPGLPGGDVDVFADGFSTKPAEGAARRGLGLALVRRVVDRHGGVIRVASGHGTRFTVTLPVGVTAAGTGVTS